MTADPHSPADTASRSDVELLRAMAQGDTRAAAPFYDRHAALVFGLALRMTGQRADADDVVLDVFAQVWRDAARFDGTRGSVVAWLTTITRTRALDQLRARKRRDAAEERAVVLHDEPVAMGSAPDAPGEVLEAQERATAVRAALVSLPAPQRQAIELAFYQGLTHHEVAATLQEPLGTIKTRIRLGLLKLRERLAGHAPEAVS
ncbi:MAG: sigma-70 family RNA polymerase sigma factor [Gemmatimonadaceae bacterium]|nr:sigma-70 family RNA polymerase sigma factor [Gemmatimonadaceae bacterium]